MKTYSISGHSKIKFDLIDMLKQAIRLLEKSEVVDLVISNDIGGYLDIVITEYELKDLRNEKED